MITKTNAFILQNASFDINSTNNNIDCLGINGATLSISEFRMVYFIHAVALRANITYTTMEPTVSWSGGGT